MGQRVISVFSNCLLEIADTLLDVRPRELPQMVETEEVSFMGFGVNGTLAHQPRLLLRSNLVNQRFGKLPRGFAPRRSRLSH